MKMPKAHASYDSFFLVPQDVYREIIETGPEKYSQLLKNLNREYWKDGEEKTSADKEEEEEEPQNEKQASPSASAPSEKEEIDGEERKEEEEREEEEAGDLRLNRGIPLKNEIVPAARKRGRKNRRKILNLSQVARAKGYFAMPKRKRVKK